LKRISIELPVLYPEEESISSDLNIAPRLEKVASNTTFYILEDMFVRINECDNKTTLSLEEGTFMIDMPYETVRAIITQEMSRL